MSEKELGYGYSKGNQTALSILLVCFCMWICLSFYIIFQRYTQYMLISVIGTLIFSWFIKTVVPSWSACKITITNKRVFGSVGGRQINFPISSITAAELSGVNNLIIHAGTEKITFYNLKNARPLERIITQQLIQKKGETEKDLPSSNLDDIKRFKELLDSGIITQEEFEAKKKQLLGL